MKLTLALIALLLIQRIYSQYDGREYIFFDNTISKSEIDQGIKFVTSKADSIKMNTGFEGNLKINVVYYRENENSDRKWDCFASKAAKRVEKIYGEKPKVIILDRTADDLPVQQDCVALSPMWQ